MGPEGASRTSSSQAPLVKVLGLVPLLSLTPSALAAGALWGDPHLPLWEVCENIDADHDRRRGRTGTCLSACSTDDTRSLTPYPGSSDQAAADTTSSLRKLVKI